MKDYFSTTVEAAAELAREEDGWTDGPTLAEAEWDERQQDRDPEASS